MSLSAMNWVADLDKSDFASLSATDFAVLTWLAFHHNHETGECFPSQFRLSEETGLSERTVGRAKARLQEAGLILVISRYGGIHGRQSDQIELLGRDPLTGKWLAGLDSSLSERGSR